MIGIRRRAASWTAISSVLRSVTKTASGSRSMSRTPPRLNSSLVSSASIFIRSLVGRRASLPSSFQPLSSWRREIRPDIVWKLVSRPPNQRLLTYGILQRSAHSWTTSLACFLVPTKRIVPPPEASSPVKRRAVSSSASVCRRSMMWIPSSSPWMKRRMLGFQRRVWWPKWTPASSSSFRPASGMHVLLELSCVTPRPARRDPGSLPWAGSGPLVDGGRSDLVKFDCRAGGKRAPGPPGPLALPGGGRLEPRLEVRRQRRGEVERRARARMAEGEPVGVQELAPQAVAGAAAVGRVPRERVPDRGEVGADLVRAAGLQAGLDVALARQQLEHLEMRA